MIQEFMEASNAKIISSKRVRFTPSLTVMHYGQHEGKFFYRWLVDYIQCFDSIIFSVETSRDIEGLRKKLGSTIVEKADRDSIRAKYGLYDGMNGIHLSESAESGIEEVRKWTSAKILEPGIQKFDLNAYLQENKYMPDKTAEIHQILSNYRKGTPQADADIRSQFLDLLRSEAVEVEGDRIVRFNELFWQGMHLH